MIPETLPAEVATHKDRAIAIREHAAATVVRTPAEAAARGAELRALHEKIKELTARRDEIKRPITEALAAVDRLFAEPLAALTTAKGIVSQALATFQTAQQAARDAALAASRDAALAAMNSPEPPAGAAEAARALIVAGSEPLERIAGTRTTTRIEIEITDPDAVPREFCVPHEPKVRAALKLDPNRKIPGVTARTVTSVSSTGRG